MRVMPKVKFNATARMQSFLYSKGGVKAGTYGGKATTKVVGPEYMKDGDIIDMPDFEAKWCLSIHPDNFELVSEKKVKKPEPEPEDSESEE